MSAPSHDCDRYREELLLEAADRAQAEPACGSCVDWARRQGQLTGLLGSLERHPAPVALDLAIAETLELGAAGQEPLLRGLERVTAPAALDQALAFELAEAAPTQAASAVVRLGRLEAPGVLDRLVDEDLRDPAAVTRRFSRSLFRFEGPRSLADRIDRELRDPAPHRRTLRLSLGGLAAAALLAVTLLPLLNQGPDGPVLRFEVVEVGELDQLDPFARSLVEGLAGGKVNAVQPRDDQNPRSTTDGGGR